jgi:hypothetical protein
MIVHKSAKYNQPTYWSLSLNNKNIREAKNRTFQSGANILRKPTRIDNISRSYTRPKKFFFSPIRRRVPIKESKWPPSLIYAYFEKREGFPGRFI